MPIDVNAWTPYGSEGASMFSHPEYNVYVPPQGKSFNPYVQTLIILSSKNRINTTYIQIYICVAKYGKKQSKCKTETDH